MIPDHASLRRQPLFTPIWLAALGAFLGLIILACATWVWATADSTTVVLIPDGAKAPNAGADPPLTPAGEARAARLAGLFGDAAESHHIDAIYIAPTARSRLTAEPLAGKLGLTPVVAAGDAPAALARRVLHAHAGGRILIVAPDDGMPELVDAFGGGSSLPARAEQSPGVMYIVAVPRIGRANVLRVSY